MEFGIKGDAIMRLQTIEQFVDILPKEFSRWKTALKKESGKGLSSAA